MKRSLTALAALTVLATQATAMIHTDATTTARDLVYGSSVKATSGKTVEVDKSAYLTGEGRTQVRDDTLTVSSFEGAAPDNRLR